MIMSFAIAGTPVKAQAESVLKVGVFDLQEAINKSKKGQQAKSKLASKFEKAQKDLKSQEAAIEKMQKDLEKQASVLSVEAKFEKEKALKRKVRDFQDKYADYTQGLKREEMEITQPIVKDLLELAHKYGKEQGFTLILEKQKAGVIYTPDAADITAEIIKLYDSGR